MSEESVALRALIVEDEWVARSYLAELLEASGLASVVAAVGTAAQALEVLQGMEVEVAFIDVNLTGAEGPDAGLDLARALLGMPGGPSVVLATAASEHALEAYELGVVDYLRKPFTRERVGRCLLRVKACRPARIAAPNLLRVVARKGRSLVFLRLEEVFAFEAAGRLVCVHGQLDMDLSLAALEAKLAGHVLRVHRNWLVNVAHVLELSRDGAETHLSVGSAALAGGPLLIPVTRERAAEVRAALLERVTSGRP
mgnify:CR=1 FL=1